MHKSVVIVLQDEKYKPLYAISAPELCHENNLALVDEVSDRIRECYAKEFPPFENRVNQATDALVTKILLGTFGCVPAFDKYFVKTVKKYGMSSGVYNKHSILDMAKFYCSHYEAFEKLRRELSQSGTTYPPMKLLDMCFWEDYYLREKKKPINITKNAE